MLLKGELCVAAEFSPTLHGSAKNSAPWRSIGLLHGTSPNKILGRITSEASIFDVVKSKTKTALRVLYLTRLD